MDLWCPASVVYGIAFIPASSHIWPTILKSMSLFLFILFLLAKKPIHPLRALLSLIRNHGDCPCPCCLVNKKDIGKMGQVLNLWRHVSETHSYIGKKIRDAHDFIFKLGYNVASAAVECLLSLHSWVPMLVSPAYNFDMDNKLTLSKECFCRKAWKIWLWSVSDSHCRPDAQIQVRCMECSFYAPYSYFVCRWSI